MGKGRGTRRSQGGGGGGSAGERDVVWKAALAMVADAEVRSHVCV